MREVCVGHCGPPGAHGLHQHRALESTAVRRCELRDQDPSITGDEGHITQPVGAKREATEKVIIPIKDGDTIRFHVAWRINASMFRVYIDTTTGKQISFNQLFHT